MRNMIIVGLSLLTLVTTTNGVGAQEQYMWNHGAREPFANGEKAFQDVKALLARDYLDNVSDENLYRGAIIGMLQSAGNRKWDSLLSPIEYAGLTRELEGQVAGIGVEIDLSSQPGVVTILNAFNGSPAERAGLRAGDRVLKVDGKSVREPNTEQAARSIAGKPGSTVTLTLLRDDQVITKTVTRANVVVPAVSDQLLPDGTALVWLRTFNSKTPTLLHETLGRLAGHKLRGLVLDVRHNQGGLFDKMVDCAGELLPRGSAVAIEELRGKPSEHSKQSEIVKTTRDPVLHDVPMVVLVDGMTASGAEILAGALRDVMHARLVGTRTQGKWNAQRIAELANGYAIKFTVGLFKTPKGEAPDGKGLEPDVPVDLNEHALEQAQRMADYATRLAADAQLRAAVALLK